MCTCFCTCFVKCVKHELVFSAPSVGDGGSSLRLTLGWFMKQKVFSSIRYSTSYRRLSQLHGVTELLQLLVQQCCELDQQTDLA